MKSLGNTHKDTYQSNFYFKKSNLPTTGENCTRDFERCTLQGLNTIPQYQPKLVPLTTVADLDLFTWGYRTIMEYILK